MEPVRSSNASKIKGGSTAAIAVLLNVRRLDKDFLTRDADGKNKLKQQAKGFAVVDLTMYTVDTTGSKRILNDAEIKLATSETLLANIKTPEGKEDVQRLVSKARSGLPKQIELQKKLEDGLKELANTKNSILLSELNLNKGISEPLVKKAVQFDTTQKAIRENTDKVSVDVGIVLTGLRSHLTSEVIKNNPEISTATQSSRFSSSSSSSSSRR